jgi:hypothetical protein
MKILYSGARVSTLTPRVAILTGVFAVIYLFTPDSAVAQRSYKKTFPAGENIRLRLKNWNGKIEVQGCNCNVVKISATLESSATRINPEMADNGLVVDLIRDNPGRDDIGNVVITLKVPYSSTVDLETKLGDISVSNINGSLVRAHVSSEGDIQLLNINSSNVIAENTRGTILFDGELQAGGSYRFQSADGDINIRIPAYSAFRLEAMAPLTRSITLGSFSGTSMTSIGEGRKIVGSVGDGRATLNVMNFRGRIAFLSR